MKRRKIKRRRNNKRNCGVKFLGIIGIIILAIVSGYLTARYIIAPILGYDTEVLKLDFPSNFISGLKSEKETEETETSSGYALQFGVFSSEESAEKLVEQLAGDGIETEIKETDNKYKVISQVIKTKDEAVKKLKEVKTDEVLDVFITAIE